jgi:hypothetical protein
MSPSAPPIRPCPSTKPHERHEWRLSLNVGPLLECLGISERTNVAPLGAPPWVTDPAERESMEADRAAALNARAAEQSRVWAREYPPNVPTEDVDAGVSAVFAEFPRDTWREASLREVVGVILRGKEST